MLSYDSTVGKVLYEAIKDSGLLGQCLTYLPRFLALNLGLNPYVLAGRSDGHFKGFSPCKRAFDKKVGDLPRWTLHDLRRTSRSLMSRAGVRPDIAERVMGHAITGVASVYDRHSYRDEKAAALRRLAGQIETILHRPAENVMPIRKAGESCHA